MTPDALRRVEAAVRAVNASAPVICTTRCAVAMDQILGLRAYEYDAHRAAAAPEHARAHAHSHAEGGVGAGAVGTLYVRIAEPLDARKVCVRACARDELHRRVALCVCICVCVCVCVRAYLPLRLSAS